MISRKSEAGMGGPGSGNRWRTSRATCEASLRIDLRYMRREGLLAEGRTGSLSWSRNGEPSGSVRYRRLPGVLEVTYRARSPGEDWQDISERMPIDEVPQPFGGSRSFFRCLRCNKRCLVLYGGFQFRCRVCHHLAYQSQNGDRGDRARTQMSRIVERLKSRIPEEFEFLPPRPKGMHAKTYARLAKQHDHYAMQFETSLTEIMARWAKYR